MSLYDTLQPGDVVAPAGMPLLKVSDLTALLHILLALGYQEQAFARAEEVVSLAQKLSHPYTLGHALTRRMWFHQYRREVGAARHWADAVIALCNEQGMPHYLAFGIITRGWVLTMRGQIEEGVAQMREGLAARLVTGTLLFHPYLVAMLADAQGRAGQIEEARDTLAEASSMMEKTGERRWESDFHRMKGQLLLQSKSQGVQSEAESCFRQAIDVARGQSAKSLELRAVTSLSRLFHQQGKEDEARQMLTEIYGWFTEGFDTADLKEAKALLDELA